MDSIVQWYQQGPARYISKQVFVMLVSMEGTVMEQRYNMAFFAGLLLACFFGCPFLDESPVIITEDERLDQEINKEIVQTE